MKQIFTLLSVLFFAVSANAQFTENFENYSSLSGNCWKLSMTNPSTTSPVINGNASIGVDPTNASEITTPYLDFTGTTTIAFKYQLNNKLNNNSSRTVQVGTTDVNGSFTLLNSFTLDKTDNAKTTVAYSQNFTITGTKRFTIRVNAQSGDGNSYIVFDDLSVSTATKHYNAFCNTAPVATNANFATVSYAPFTGTLAGNATDANGETLTFAADTLPLSSGTLVINPNGTFVFTPLGSFVGGAVKFTYYVTDNGYDPARSNTATVTITFPAKAALPVNISNFSGAVAGNKAQITWSVTQNEEGNYFQLEKSTDGKTFTAAAVVMNTGKSGAETYNFADASQNGAVYYRLKVVNKSAAFFYSRTIALQQAGEAKASNLTLLQNPVTSTLNFSYQSVSNSTGVVNIYNMSGVKVASSQLTLH
ncbi:MAG TPA: Ig-like domain-containing protein, partial [Flavisolibacter sp.]|nr:Ig-like domain-containing protein [Flavisolibacter sp.]